MSNLKKESRGKRTTYRQTDKQTESIPLCNREDELKHVFSFENNIKYLRIY